MLAILCGHETKCRTLSQTSPMTASPAFWLICRRKCGWIFPGDGSVCMKHRCHKGEDASTAGQRRRKPGQHGTIVFLTSWVEGIDQPWTKDDVYIAVPGRFVYAYVPHPACDQCAALICIFWTDQLASGCHRPVRAAESLAEDGKCAEEIRLIS